MGEGAEVLSFNIAIPLLKIFPVDIHVYKDSSWDPVALFIVTQI